MWLRRLLGLRPETSKTPRRDGEISTPQSVDDIKNARKNSTTLAPLRTAINQLVGDRHCFVIGSAPKATFVEHERSICVNGSGWAAARMGISCPDLTVIGGWTLRGDSPVRSATLDAIKGLRSDLTILIDFGTTFEDGKRVLASVDYQYRDVLCVNAFDRAVILGDVCGEEISVGPKTLDLRPSMGMFAVALALWAGCRQVTMTGFSLSGGHAYLAGNTPRLHVEGDKWFLDHTGHLPLTIV